MKSTDSVAEFRKSLPAMNLSSKSAFLNFAATCPLTRGSIRAIQESTAQMAEPLGKHFYQALNLVEQARKELGLLINAHPKEIAFTQNTSTAISQLALAVKFKPGDKVIAADNEFPSNFYAWQNLKSRGVDFQSFKIEKNIPVTETLALLDLKNVKLLALSAVSYQNGRLHEIKQIAKFCQERNILFCVDAIQAIGAIPVDVKDWGIDMLASGSQKWLMGPVGAGFIYVRQELMESLEVPFVGWTSSEYPEYFQLTDWKFASEMTRFEPGLPNFLSLVGLYQSLIELKDFGWERVFQLISQNQNYLRENLKALGCQFLTGEKDLLAGIVCFEFPKGPDHREVDQFYHDKNITVTVRENYIRVSPHFLSSREELDYFIRCTAELFKKTWTAKPDSKLETLKPDNMSYNTFLILGGAGNLGQILAQKLLNRGHSLVLIDRPGKTFDELSFKTEKKQSLEKIALDLQNQTQVNELLKNLKEKYPKGLKGLIQSAGVESVDLFGNLSTADIDRLIDTNFRSLTHIYNHFVKDLGLPKSEGGVGILNVISSTGRCGYPLLSVYGATNGAMWSLGEAMSRESEISGIPVCNYVAPSMHSPMQKRMGRISLRYFWIQGGFDYQLTEDVADEALSAYFDFERIFLSGPNRLKTWVNALWPKIIDSKIAKAMERSKAKSL